MSFKLPLYRQENDNTCALACLRMVLAAYGSYVGEEQIRSQARMESKGTEISELERLARQFGLVAHIHEATLDELRQFLDEDQLPIAYIDRAVFDMTPSQRVKHSLRYAKIHVVIPTRVASSSVTYHDPLAPRVVRKSMRLFRLAYSILGNHCVVCSMPGVNE
jgi:hypothetical protein